MITTISLDLDGTLISDKGDRYVWDEAIPREYADANDLALDDAKDIVYAEYYRAQHIENISDWEEIHYWVNRLDLANDAAELNERIASINEPYDDIDAIDDLVDHTLAVFTNSSRPLMEAKLDYISQEFSATISAPSDYDSNKRRVAAWEAYLDDLDVEPDEIIHVGDRPLDDVTMPGKVGVTGYHLDRDDPNADLTSLHDIKDMV